MICMQVESEPEQQIKLSLVEVVLQTQQLGHVVFVEWANMSNRNELFRLSRLFVAM